MPEEKDRWYEMFVSKYEKEIQIIQDDVTAESLSSALLAYLDAPEKVAELQQQFLAMHHELRQNASENAADAVLSVVERACSMGQGSVKS